MSHDLLLGTSGDARFLDTRGPAWHRLGHVVTGREITAVEGLSIIGAPEVVIVDAPPFDVPGIGIVDPERRFIVRSAMGDLPAKTLGVVTDPNYHLVGPREFCTVLDGAVGRSVETIGMIKDGKVLFVSFQLPSFDVNGDEHENYLCCYNGMSGSDALKAMNTPVRVVCQNTLLMAESVTTEQMKIPHKISAMQELGAWIVDMYARALARGEVVKEALEVLANYRPTAEEATSILAATYPMPRKPSDFGPKHIVDQRERQYDARMTFALGSRDAVNAMWNGAGTGSDTRAAAGTLFGLYQATVEYEDYRKHRGVGGNVEVMAESALIGMRREHKEWSFAACMETAGVSQFKSSASLDRAAETFSDVLVTAN